MSWWRQIGISTWISLSDITKITWEILSHGWWSDQVMVHPVDSIAHAGKTTKFLPKDRRLRWNFVWREIFRARGAFFCGCGFWLVGNRICHPDGLFLAMSRQLRQFFAATTHAVEITQVAQPRDYGLMLVNIFPLEHALMVFLARDGTRVETKRSHRRDKRQYKNFILHPRTHLHVGGLMWGRTADKGSWSQEWLVDEEIKRNDSQCGQNLLSRIMSRWM